PRTAELGPVGAICGRLMMKSPDPCDPRSWRFTKGLTFMGLRRVSGGLRTALLAALLATGLAAPVLPATVTSADVRTAAPVAGSRPPLAGKIVGIDPGHNGLNHTSPAFLARKVWNGREWEGCDTTGTQT